MKNVEWMTGKVYLLLWITVNILAFATQTRAFAPTTITETNHHHRYERSGPSGIILPSSFGSTSRGYSSTSSPRGLRVLPALSGVLDPTQLQTEQPSSSLIELAVWITAFASSHIGLSAIRSTLIARTGHLAAQLGLVGNDSWQLPNYWPGDAVGGAQIFPDADTAGRQLYRVGYTIVSFVALGKATIVYLSGLSGMEAPPALTLTGFIRNGHTSYHHHDITTLLWFYAAVASNVASLTSLANASPLGLMPGFQTTISTAASSNSDAPSSVPIVVQRNDALKFSVRGLTRLTRHPLILPVVPWGVAHAQLLGGHGTDWIFFGGLAAYAVAGCAAQDLRVMRQEGSVGTCLSETVNADEESKSSLQAFFEQTSFVPLGAIVDGRQPLIATLMEIPWLATVPAAVVGFWIENTFLQWLGDFYTL